MQHFPTIIITCDSLLEFEEDAAAFAQGEPVFVNGAVPVASGNSATTATNSPPSPHASNQEPES